MISEQFLAHVVGKAIYLAGGNSMAQTGLQSARVLIPARVRNLREALGEPGSD